MFPLTITASTPDLSDIAEITFYAKGEGDPELLKTYPSPTEDTFTFKWNSVPVSGAYELYADIVTKDSATYQSQKILVNIL
jgi:hypothetical protein